MNILYILLRGILSLITILTLIRNEKIYQAHKHTHPTNKIRYIISQLIILTLYTSSLILTHYTKIHIIILILNEEAYLTKKFIYRMNLIMYMPSYRYT